ncbi:hypothetical protein B7486_71345, partial [cyanobacterium TDX16]
DATGGGGSDRDVLLPGTDAPSSASRWTVSVGAPLLLDAGVAGPAQEGVVATARMRRALDGLRDQADLVVVLSRPAPTLAAVAWSAHADVVAVVVEEGCTRQGEVRAALAVLDRAALRRPVRVLLVPTDVAFDPATEVAEPSVVG